MKFHFYNGRKKLVAEVKEMKGIWRGFGLMMRGGNTSNLLFEFERPSRVAITSLFVFFPFAAVWLDEKRKIVDARISTPFEMSFTPKKNAKYLLEFPMNSSNVELLAKISTFLK